MSDILELALLDEASLQGISEKVLGKVNLLFPTTALAIWFFYVRKQTDISFLTFYFKYWPNMEKLETEIKPLFKNVSLKGKTFISACYVNDIVLVNTVFITLFTKLYKKKTSVRRVVNKLYAFLLEKLKSVFFEYFIKDKISQEKYERLIKRLKADPEGEFLACAQGLAAGIAGLTEEAMKLTFAKLGFVFLATTVFNVAEYLQYAINADKVTKQIVDKVNLPDLWKKIQQEIDRLKSAGYGDILKFVEIELKFLDKKIGVYKGDLLNVIKVYEAYKSALAKENVRQMMNMRIITVILHYVLALLHKLKLSWLASLIHLSYNSFFAGPLMAASTMIYVDNVKESLFDLIKKVDKTVYIKRQEKEKEEGNDEE